MSKPETAGDLRRLLSLTAQLGADEMEALCLVAEGLVRGRGPYGEWREAEDRRDLIDEATEELRDHQVYVAFELLRLLRRRKAGG